MLLLLLLTLELLVQATARGDGQCADKLLELDCPALVLVKDIKHILGKLARVAEREELAVDFPELWGESVRAQASTHILTLLVQLAAGAVLEESLVPLLELLRG